MLLKTRVSFRYLGMRVSSKIDLLTSCPLFTCRGAGLSFRVSQVTFQGAVDRFIFISWPEPGVTGPVAGPRLFLAFTVRFALCRVLLCVPVRRPGRFCVLSLESDFRGDTLSTWCLCLRG